MSLTGLARSQANVCYLESLFNVCVLLPTDIAEIVEQKQADGLVSYYVHYVDCKSSYELLAANLIATEFLMLFNDALPY